MTIRVVLEQARWVAQRRSKGNLKMPKDAEMQGDDLWIQARFVEINKYGQVTLWNGRDDDERHETWYIETDPFVGIQAWRIRGGDITKDNFDFTAYRVSILPEAPR